MNFYTNFTMHVCGVNTAIYTDVIVMNFHSQSVLQIHKEFAFIAEKEKKKTFRIRPNTAERIYFPLTLLCNPFHFFKTSLPPREGQTESLGTNQDAEHVQSEIWGPQNRGPKTCARGICFPPSCAPSFGALVFLLLPPL